MPDPEQLWEQARRTGSPIVSPVADDGTVEATFLWRGEPGRLIRDCAAAPRADLRFYLAVGDRETWVDKDGIPHLLAANRQTRDALTAKGYPVTYAEYHGGQDYVNWRDNFADAPIAVLSAG